MSFPGLVNSTFAVRAPFNSPSDQQGWEVAAAGKVLVRTRNNLTLPLASEYHMPFMT